MWERICDVAFYSVGGVVMVTWIVAGAVCLPFLYWMARTAKPESSPWLDNWHASQRRVAAVKRAARRRGEHC